MRSQRIAVSPLLGMATLLVSSWALGQPSAPEPAPTTAPSEPNSEGATALESGGSGVLDVPEAPPAPPSAGSSKAGAKSPPPGAPTAFADEAATLRSKAGSSDPTAGYHGIFFVRDTDGQFRISPTGMLQLDLYTYFGPEVGSLPRAAGGAGLPTQLSVRRARFGLHGEMLKRWSWMASVDVLGASASTVGVDEVSAVSPPVEATEPGSNARSGGVALAPREIWVNYSLAPFFNLLLGQTQAPVSMESRTADTALPMLNRSLANRSLVAPGGRETGLMFWGSVMGSMVAYEFMLAGGDGENRATVDSAFDVMGRVTVRPLPMVKALREAHIGISARHGERDPSNVAYDLTGVSSSQGFRFFEPSYVDSQGLRTHILPSGAQNLIGGELRVPVGPIELTHEMHYAAYNTREALAGFQLTNTERLGSFTGLGFTSRLTWWALGDEHVAPESGVLKPPRLELKRKVPYKRGLELDGVVSGIVASYEAASRDGELDPLTPGSTERPATDLSVWQFALAASYWHTQHVRLQLAYSTYWVPGAGTSDNLAVAPSQVVARAGDAELLHELGTRVQLSF
jgi:hypothetical protein